MATLTSQLIVRLVDQVTGPARKAGASLKGLNDTANRATAGLTGRLAGALDENNRALDRTRGRVLDAIGAFYAFKSAVTGVIGPTIRLEEAMADLRKVANVDDTGMKALEDAVKRVSAATGRAQSEVAATMAAAAQAGIATGDLESYAEMVLKVGVAWDVTGDQAGEALAKIGTAMGWTVDQTRQFSDEINVLSDSTAASSTDLLEYARRTLAMGKAAGFSSKETLALGSAMISAGAQPDVAATSFLNLTRALTKGASATKAQRGAFKSLGLDAKALAKGMQKDALGTTMRVLEAIRKAPAENRVSLISSIFGDEARALGPILENLGLLHENYEAIADEAKTAGSVQKEFETRSRTTANAVARLRNSIEAIAISLGSALTPALADLADKFAPVAGRIADLVARFPRLTQVVVGAVGSLVAFRVGLIGLQFIGLNLKGALLTVAFGVARIGSAAVSAARNAVALQVALGAMSGQKLIGFQTFTTALRGMVMAVPGVSAIGTALSAIGGALAAISAPAWLAIGAAVAVVAGAGALLWRYWGRVSSVASGIAKRIGEELSPAIEKVRPLFEALKPVVSAIGDAFAYVGEKIGEFFDWIGSFFEREVLNDEQKANWEKSGYDAANLMIKAIKSVFSGLIEWASGLGSQFASALTNAAVGAINRVRGMLPTWAGGVDAPSAPPANDNAAPPATSGHRATGGPAWAGSSYLVGEKGPEIFTPKSSGTVTPAGKMGGQVSVVNHFAISGVNDPDEVARRASRMVIDDLNRLMRGSHSDFPAR